MLNFDRSTVKHDILRIFKMISTSGFLTALKCNKFVFGRGSALDPTGGAYSAPTDPLAGLRGPTSKWRGKGSEEVERKGMGGTGPPFCKFLDPPLALYATCVGKNSTVITLNTVKTSVPQHLIRKS